MADQEELTRIEAQIASPDRALRAEAVALLRTLESRGEMEQKRQIVRLLAASLTDLDAAVRDEAFFGLLNLGLLLDPDLRRRVIGAVERAQLVEIGRSQLSSVQLDRLLKGYHPTGAVATPSIVLRTAPAVSDPSSAGSTESRTADPAADLPPEPNNPKEKLLLQMLSARIRQFFNADLAAELDLAWRKGGSLNSDLFLTACHGLGPPVFFSLAQLLSSTNVEARAFAQKLLADLGAASLPYALETLAEPDRSLRQHAYRILFDVLSKDGRWSASLQKLAFAAATIEEFDPRLAAVSRLRTLLLGEAAPDAV